jgi:hypothetical protein
MNVLDDHALKVEIDEIAKRIDHIIKKVSQVHPDQPEDRSAESTEETILE